ncbi:hypothetical protein JB92DRAFT_2888341 [Gautieria morchelliformis]|nr:hypothetical protein JB92DRAFT_2888341 [Gautieria morchelliformis]
MDQDFCAHARTAVYPHQESVKDGGTVMRAPRLNSCRTRGEVSAMLDEGDMEKVERWCSLFASARKSEIRSHGRSFMLDCILDRSVYELPKVPTIGCQTLLWQFGNRH